MKVIQINTVLNGCTGRIACSLQQVLEDESHMAIIAYGRGKDVDKENVYQISHFLDYSIHAGLTRVFDTCGLHSRGVTKRFLQWLEKEQPDIIHLHNLHGYYINYSMLFDYIKKKNVRVFWTMHDCWPFTGHCPYYTYVQCEKWKTKCFKCQQKKHHPKSCVFDRSTKNYKNKKEAFTSVEDMTIITPSKWLKKQVKSSFLSEYRVLHIPNGIPLRKFHPTENKFRQEMGLQNKIIVLGVANLWAETKGLRYFYELNELLSRDYQIVLVGLSEKQKADLPDDIIGIEKTENIEQLVDIYSSADMFVNPTLEDNFPTTNIEALACGTPVITFDTGGSPESVDSTCGIVVPKNAESIKKACLELGKKDEKKVELCIKRAKNYDENKCYRKYIQIYQSE